MPKRSKGDFLLSNLRIENIAVIERADISFDVGLNVLSGETGAGKSIIIDSITAILGERTSKELIRTGEKNASVTAYFEKISKNVKDKLIELDIPVEEDGTLLVSRKINIDGRNVCKVNGAPVTVTMLKELGKSLIDIHGQHDNRFLLSNENHCFLLDAVADTDELLQTYQGYYKKYVTLKKKLKSISSSEEERQRTFELLSFQKNEIEKAGIVTGEIKSLQEKILKIRNAEKIASAIRNACSFLNGDDENSGAVLKSKNVSDDLSEISDIFEDVKPDIEKIKEASFIFEETANSLERKLSQIEFSASELEQSEERLDLLLKLKRKYGDEEEMLSLLSEINSQLEDFEESEEQIDEITQELNFNAEKMLEFADKITSERKHAGETLIKKLCDELAYLDMPDVRFEISIKDKPLSMRGKDDVEILLSANAGESVKPLSKTASGGELSRIMLAIKNVTSVKNDVDTMIFDEIDSGVSGKTAEKIGIKLHSVSDGKQVICVTHSAQIAAKADRHLLIEKSTFDGCTYTQVRALTDKERKYELARIIGGVVITQGQLKVAEEMLKGEYNDSGKD